MNTESLRGLVEGLSAEVESLESSFRDDYDAGRLAVYREMVVGLSVILNQAPAVQAADGWVVVPRGLTEDMENAWFGAPRTHDEDGKLNFQAAYAAMLSAAPAAPVAELAQVLEELVLAAMNTEAVEASACDKDEVTIARKRLNDARSAAIALYTTPHQPTEAAPEHVRKLVGKLDQWRACMSYNESYFGEPAGLVKSTVAELARAVDAIYPPAPAAPDPLAGVTIHSVTRPLAAAKKAEEPTEPARDREDAERYRWLREASLERNSAEGGIPWPVIVKREHGVPTMVGCFEIELDAAIDDARAAGGGGRD